jgi:arginyl-tRNA synthetase
MLEMTRRQVRASIERVLRASTWGEDVDFEVWRSRPKDWRGQKTSEWCSNVLHRARVGRELQDGFVSALRQDASERGLAWDVGLERGFAHFFMNEKEQNGALERARQQGEGFGRGESLKGERANIEWVSADPSGPLSAQAARIALSGEALSRLLEAHGAQVTREYFLNDDPDSSKARALGESVLAWYRSAFEGEGDLEEDPAILSSEWVRSVAREVVREDGNRWLLVPRDEARQHFANRARDAALASQRASLSALGVTFDVWTSEANLLSQGVVQSMLERLKASGELEERAGSSWLKTSTRGDEADRPLVRKGRPTYLATDIAYHNYKFSRGFGRLINIWTSQHRPYVARTKAALELAGLDANALQVLACEGVRPRRDGIAISGEGSGVSADQLLEDVPANGLKYFLIAPNWDDVAVLEVEVATRDDESNPAYAIQLLPSRLAMLANELEARVEYMARTQPIAEDFAAWTETEKSLRRLVALWPDESEAAAQNLEPQRVARFALELAQAAREDLASTRASTTFERPQPELAARLALLQAARVVAKQALHILNIAPREQF